ncbi:MAG: phosphopantothenoylcysteine decarboxylase, partial [Rubricoccaceae bacterium]|nr:phosphopantothenoylcysteine decarboxylase [Rubricoccaceae bacterium]
ETQEGEANALDKLREKHLDWIVLNHANEEGSGFGTTTNRVTLLSRDGAKEELPQMPKTELARALFDRVVGVTA